MDQRNSNCTGISGAQLRKIRKPLIERKRRERINDSLNQLKTLVLEALCKDESNCSKMDKADILEMAVQHLRAMHHQQQQQKSVHFVSRHQQHYTNGFNECSKQVDRFLGSAPGVQADLTGRVSRHLNTVKAEPQPVELVQPYAVPVASPVTSLPGSPSYCTTDSVGSLSPLTVRLTPQTSPTPHVVSFRPVVVAPVRHDPARTTSPQLADDAPSARPAAYPTSFVYSSPEVAVKNETDLSVWRPW